MRPRSASESGTSDRKRTRHREESPYQRFIDAWQSFRAEVGEGGDGAQSCGAKIFYRKPGTRRWKGISGATGTGRGHAEMAAVYSFVDEVCDFDVDTFLGYEIEVSCPTKPCCCRCSAALGLLGVVARSDTKKSTRSMGSTEWGLAPRLRAFVCTLAGIREDELIAYRDYRHVDI